jgi:hypothetical protein
MTAYNAVKQCDAKARDCTFMLHVTVCRYLKVGRMSKQTCTAAVTRKKRSLSRCNRPSLLRKGYSNAGAESILTCSAYT